MTYQSTSTVNYAFAPMSEDHMMQISVDELTQLEMKPFPKYTNLKSTSVTPDYFSTVILSILAL